MFPEGILYEGPAPDIETASAGYAARFAGETGAFFLQRQLDFIRLALKTISGTPLRILELGGGHNQLAPFLRADGHWVVQHGSSFECFQRSHSETTRPEEALVGALSSLPVRERSFDVVLAVRLLAHVAEWKEFLRLVAPLAGRGVIFDYAPLDSANILTPILFPIKKRIERNTRPYFCHWSWSLSQELARLGFPRQASYRQFAVPMGIHRALKNRSRSERAENFLAQMGIARLIGSPGLICAQRDSK